MVQGVIYPTKNKMLNKRGFSVVEIIIAAAIFTLTVGAFVLASEVLRELAANNVERTEAALLLEEGAEAMLILRDFSWEANVAILETDSLYYLYWDGSSYQMSEEEVVINQSYLRRVTLYEAHRNASGTYVESGTVDPDTRRVLIEIIKVDDNTELASAEMLLHNAYE